MVHRSRGSVRYSVVGLFSFFFSSRRRHTIFDCDWSSDVCSSDLEVDIVRLNITDFSLSYSGGMTSVFENVSWEIWGRPVFVFFVPPTEPDNTYLVDRNSTIVRVRLAAIGVATLEWDGVNRSMLADGPNLA